jgi:hypothetical protein
MDRQATGRRVVKTIEEFFRPRQARLALFSSRFDDSSWHVGCVQLCSALLAALHRMFVE